MQLGGYSFAGINSHCQGLLGSEWETFTRWLCCHTPCTSAPPAPQGWICVESWRALSSKSHAVGPAWANMRCKEYTCWEKTKSCHWLSHVPVTGAELSGGKGTTSWIFTAGILDRLPCQPQGTADLWWTPSWKLLSHNPKQLLLTSGLSGTWIFLSIKWHSFPQIEPYF